MPGTLRSKPGTRVLWLVPRADVDRILPLQITPKPDALVRVLVGRIDYLTPEVEELDERAVQELADKDSDAQQRANQHLAQHGRFYEPHLRRVIARTTDAAVRQKAEELAR